MAINLYKHNEEAYNSALKMLNMKGKAAVIHPTGTGKSFIGFKLCENFPEKTVCWLSPTDYIFKTQLENLKKASGGYEPQNIIFFTYANLMNMSWEEIAEIKPDFIILDEFHRCGAEMWEKGLIRYAEKADISGVKASYCSPDSYKLGEWLRGQKRQFLKGKLDSERQSRLENIGMCFSD